MLRLKLICLLLALITALVVYAIPCPEGLCREGQATLAVLGFCFVMGRTEALLLSVTSLLAIALLPLVGAMFASQAFSFFGNHGVFLFWGIHHLSRHDEVGAKRQNSARFLQGLRSNPRLLLSGIILSCAFMAMWVPEHAVAALMFPIALGIGSAPNLEPRWSN